MKKSVISVMGMCIICLSICADSKEVMLGPFEFEHAPYADSECKGCHTSNVPQGGDISISSPDLCYGCHDVFDGQFMHSPVGVGDCLLCHDPHGSDNAMLLKTKEPDLCYLCHDELRTEKNGMKSIAHKPALERCTICHSPHVSIVNSNLLTVKMKKLCAECHETQGIAMRVNLDVIGHKHGPLATEKNCANCHNAHGSSYKHFLLAEPMDICLRCHNKERTDSEGKILADFKGLLEENKNHHGPIRQKDCSGCHNPHGSDYYRLLLAKYPKEFYTTSYNKADYNLCFLCHDLRMLDNKETRTLTDFRNGTKNLHYLHVNKTEKGRTCRACHEVHASNNFNHIRESVPFGKINWPLQLKYQPLYVSKKTGQSCDQLSSDCIQEGGSCVACHNRKYYNNSLPKK